MSVSSTQNGSDVNALLRTTPEKYVSLGDLVDYQKPDNRDLLIKTYGDQGITGFLQLTGATRSAGTNDEVQYWEEGRLHKTVSGAYDASEGKIYVEGNNTDAGTEFVARLNDVLLAEDGQRLVVTGRDNDTDGATTATRHALTVKRLDGTADGAADDVGTDGDTGTFASKKFAIIGNVYAQGTGQPTEFYETDVTKRTNPFFITKETFHVTGSQATNIGWINIGNGDYRWYVKGEMDTRKRFMNQREMMMLFSQDAGTTAGSKIDLASGSVAGSEGYFQAVERRGITTAGVFGSGDGLSDIDNIIFELDKQGAPAEYAMYLDQKTSLNIDDMLAVGLGNGGTDLTGGLSSQFGAFQNSRDMAVELGFKSFGRGSYTFHKHGWKLLSDPTLVGAFGAAKPVRGAMVPMTQVVDAKTGTKAPALEMNYKEVNGYSREMEHWVEGGGVLGFNTNGEDLAKFHYRSEANLITRAANQHVMIK